MRSIFKVLIICLLSSSTSFAQNSLTADFDASLSSFTSKRVAYLDLSQSLQEKQISFKNTKDKLAEHEFYTLKNPHMTTDRSIIRYYSLFYNQVSGETQKSYNSNLYDLRFIYDTNKRSGEDLATDITYIQSIDYIWTLDESVKLTDNQQKEEFNRLYKELTVIISKYFGNKNGSDSFKTAQGAFTRFILGGRDTDGRELAEQQLTGETPPQLKKGTVWGKINKVERRIDGKFCLLSLIYNRDTKQYSISFNAKVR